MRTHKNLLSHPAREAVALVFMFAALCAVPLLCQQSTPAQQPKPGQQTSPNQQPTPVPQTTPAPAPASAPQTDDKPSFSVQVKVVNVPATVRDKHGKIVSDLTKDDFVLEEDGRPQVIHYFSRESDLPLTLGLLVDTSFSQRRVLEKERSASYTFLDRMVHQEKDAAFIIHFDHEVELLQDLTNSHQKLQVALNSLQVGRPSDSSSSSGGSGGGPPSGYPGGRGGGTRRVSFGHGTLLYDAVYLASDELMKKQQGRKAVIILSDGVDRGSKVSLGSAIEAAQRSDTIVYSILYKDDEDYGNRDRGFGGGMGRRGPYGGGGGRRRYPQEERPDGKKILERISKETGGRLFEVSGRHPVDKIFSQIEEELRGQYSLGYTSDRAELAGYHKIHLQVKQKDMTVQSRDGYYADH
ncbi:MAG: VWA domain-containing protein [Acidobacteriia bacterium]|nr:VWA domain-containing protein [Terriglobia bacterium]